MKMVIGIIAGLASGCLVGYLKNCIIWFGYLKKSNNENSADTGVSGVYIRSMISYGVNILTLAAAFFIRNVVPFDGMAFLIGIAVGLSIMNKALAAGQKRREAKGL